MSTAGWLGWVLLVLVVALTTTNPLYLSVVFLCVVLVGVLAPKRAGQQAGFRPLLFLGGWLFAASLVIAVVNGNYGDHVLFELPSPAFPDWLGGLALGGPVTAEGLVAAGIRGVAILCVLLAFGVVNGAVSAHRVLRMTPAALFHAGLVVTVGLVLLPAAVEDTRRIREMQALRGHGRGLRNLPGLVVPVVLGGLERAMRTAEAMEARGYAAAAPMGGKARLLGAASAPLLLFATWAWFYHEPLRPAAAVATLGGIGALVAWGLAAARARRTTVMHREAVPLVDRGLAWASTVGAVAVMGGAMGGWLEMGYNPFAGLPWPEFAPVGVVVALACGWPAARLALAQPAAPQESAGAKVLGASAREPSA